MTLATMREKRKQDIRSRILRTAREMFVHEGYAGFSMRALAGRLGCAPSATYKHFKNKNEIFDCLTQESFSALLKASAEVKDIPGEDPVERLRRGVFGYVKFGLDHPDDYKFAFLMQAPEEHAAGTRMARSETATQAFEGLKQRVQRCIDAGRLPPASLDLMAQSIWAAAHGVTSLLLHKPLFPWVARRKLISQVIDAAILGVSSAAP